MTETLTQCWFTRIHRPAAHSRRFEGNEGELVCQCRYCHRPIATWNRQDWYLADGFNVTRLAERTSGRFLTLLDRSEEMVVHRYSLEHFADEAAIEAFKAELRAEYDLDEEGCPLELIDSGEPSRPAPDRITRRAAHAPQDIRRSA